MPQTTLSFSAGHPVFAGHFPGRPIVPGVLLLDHVRRIVQARIEQTETGRSANDKRCAGISTAKFHSPAGPDESMIVDYEIDSSWVRFEIHVDSRKIADGRFSLTADEFQS